MITGRQIREARQLLRWSCRDLSERAKLTPEIIERAESTDSTPPIMLGQAAKIQAVCEAAGIRFGRVGAVLIAGIACQNDPPVSAS